MTLNVSAEEMKGSKKIRPSTKSSMLLTISDINAIYDIEFVVPNRAARDKRYRESEKGKQSIIRTRYREAKTRLVKRIEHKEQQILDLERELGNEQED